MENQIVSKENLIYPAYAEEFTERVKHIGWLESSEWSENIKLIINKSEMRIRIRK